MSKISSRPFQPFWHDWVRNIHPYFQDLFVIRFNECHDYRWHYGWWDATLAMLVRVLLNGTLNNQNNVFTVCSRCFQRMFLLLIKRTAHWFCFNNFLNAVWKPVGKCKEWCVPIMHWNVFHHLWCRILFLYYKTNITITLGYCMPSIFIKKIKKTNNQHYQYFTFFVCT